MRLMGPPSPAVACVHVKGTEFSGQTVDDMGKTIEIDGACVPTEEEPVNEEGEA